MAATEYRRQELLAREPVGEATNGEQQRFAESSVLLIGPIAMGSSVICNADNGPPAGCEITVLP